MHVIPFYLYKNIFLLFLAQITAYLRGKKKVYAAFSTAQNLISWAEKGENTIDFWSVLVTSQASQCQLKALPLLSTSG